MNENNGKYGMETDVKNMKPHDGVGRMSSRAWSTVKRKDGRRQKWGQNGNTNPRTIWASHIGREAHKIMPGSVYHKNKPQIRGSTKAAAYSYQLHNQSPADQNKLTRESPGRRNENISQLYKNSETNNYQVQNLSNTNFIIKHTVGEPEKT